VRLDHLLAGVAPADPPALAGSTDVTAITHDSRRVVPGALYCCVRGQRVDGHDLAADAVAAGAVAVVCDRPLGLGVTEVVVPDVRAAMGPIAARFWGDPSKDLQVAGVTGTNGKTTTVALLHAVLEAAGRPAGLIGTLSGGAGEAGVTRPPTTPDALDLQARLAELRDAGKVAVAMEVSSHAMVQHRVAGTRFAVVAFTNLSRDHLDLHPSMEDYFAAKASLFRPELAEVAVVNADDPYGRRLIDGARLPTTTYSLDDVVDLDVGVASSTWVWRGRRFSLPMGGRFNVANALAAATMAVELGVGLEPIAEGIASVGPVAGRFEVVEAGPPVAVVVDYAHTPDGLDQVLRSSRQAAGGGRTIVVFGCGGDRDREKRPLMGEVATTRADVAVLTSDNPRHEDPVSIIEQVRGGATGPGRLVVEPDRRRAIATALAEATDGDIVVIAGKGHETTQIVGDERRPFDDRVVASEELARLRATSPVGDAR
jgi:UDP-N-acetylmuramoyl-L-alanyl-D-glutamate--2,6-diaminopimelate ligase